MKLGVAEYRYEFKILELL